MTDIAASYTRYTQSGQRGLDAQEPTARFAGAALCRHVEIRDRFCVYPGCRCSARGADLDHTVDHGYGGATTEANSGPICRHDHRLKHTGRWWLHQPEPGHFICASLPHAGPAQPVTVTVMVIADGFHHDGRNYRWLDELEIPAAHVKAWLDGGYVRLVDELTSSTRNVGDLVDEFLANGR